METKDLQGKLVAVLGYGKEGKAVTGYLLKHGVTPVLFDERPWDDWQETEKSEIKKLGVNFIFGPDAFAELKGFDVVFRSPGIPLSKVKGQASNACVITSQTKWFFEHCPAKIIGVTGTKGKGTTATLVFEILKKQFQTYLTGNIGKVQPLEILDGLKPDDWVVYELSSFQLQDLGRSPHIGVVLMVTSEHLDYHRDIQEYVDAKSPIVKYQTAGDYSVVNVDYENSAEIGRLGNGAKLFVSRQRAVSPGCFVEGGKIVAADGVARIEIANVADLQLRGRHNLENVCAAAAAARCAGAAVDVIGEAVKSFKGLEHRLEFVAEKNGIKFYNDSFSTTPETAVAAINSFTEPELIILGGSTKNSDFTQLGKAIVGAKNIKAVILVGDEAGRIRKAIDDAGQTSAAVVTGARNMEEIFAHVKSAAASGDVVLLSPACASFGMFENYADRGNQFKEWARNF